MPHMILPARQKPVKIRPMKFNISAAASVLAMALPVLSLAQSGPELLLKPMDKDLRFDGDVSASYFFQRPAPEAGDGESIQLQRYIADGRLRLVPGWEADPRVGVSYNQLDLGHAVPGLSKQYEDLSMSVGTGIAKYQGWVAGLTVGAGYAGADAFGDGNGYYGTATLLVGRQIDDNTSIGVALDYNGNRTFKPDIPLPGLVFTKNLPERNLELSVGFPFAYGRWRPFEPLLLEVNFTFPGFVGGRVSYDVVKGVGLYASVAQRIDAYHDPELADSGERRVFFYQNLIEGGIRLSINDKLTALFAGGYAYEQDFRYGYDTQNDHEITQIGDGPYVRLEGQFRF